jgi:acetyl-CoA carboxylase carboxyltransferase component
MDEFMQERLEKLRELRKTVLLGGGQEKLDKQHSKGKLTARERIDKLLDPGSFVELEPLVGHSKGEPTDGIVTGYGTVDGRTICVFSQDATIQGGSIGKIHGIKMYRTIDRAMQMRVPLVGLNDSPGARNPKMTDPKALDEEASAMSVEKQGASVFFPNTQASGVVPQISAILGSCAGISVYSPALTDFIFMVDKLSHMFITGPRVVKSVLGEDVTFEELGGARICSAKSGVCDFRVKSEDECFSNIRKLLSFLPSSCEEKPPRVDTGDDPDRYDDEIADIVPSDPQKSFDMHDVINRLVDNGDFLEVKKEFAGEMITGFGRMDGKTVGIYANNCMVRAGSLTCDSSDKQARFIRFCDCFNIPLIGLVDTPAYQPGTQQEHMGIIRHGAKVLYALCECEVPKIVVVLRKAYGGGNLGMGSIQGMNTDLIYNWPIMEIGVMGVSQTVDLFFGPFIQQAEDPAKFREEKIKEFRDAFVNPLNIASYSPYTEDVIEPGETRRILVRSLQLLENKKVDRYRKRHGNIPL